ncbi:MAG TPA: hypothetical protein VLF39_03695 [Candidatus Saccharimonadales bacterium]|nr:hypothetical protein [Candidatus Saccharimonadales bacterium]
MSVSTNTGVGVDNKPTKNLGKRFKYIICFLLMVILAAALATAASILIVRHRENGPKCSNSVLSAAAPNLDPKKVLDLQNNAAQIESIKNYKQDPNCVYVELTFHINNIEPQKARADLNDYKKVYSLSKNLSKILGKTDSLDGLEAKVADIEKKYPIQFNERSETKNGQTIIWDIPSETQ